MYELHYAMCATKTPDMSKVTRMCPILFGLTYVADARQIHKYLFVHKKGQLGPMLTSYSRME